MPARMIERAFSICFSNYTFAAWVPAQTPPTKDRWQFKELPAVAAFENAPTTTWAAVF